MGNGSSDNPIIAIVGAGGVGGYYGARLAQHGHDVHFLLRSDYHAVARDGWTVKSCDGDFTLAPTQTHAYDDVRKMPRADWVIVTLKATNNDQYEPLVAPLLKDTTEILALQNGLGNEDRLAELFGAHRVLGGIAFVCINRVAPGLIHHIDHGIVRVGEFNGGRGPRAERIAAMFNASKVRCEVLDDLRYGRWQKLVWNIPFNGLGAVMDRTTDRLIDNPEGESLVRELMAEVIAAARADGANLPDGLIDRQVESTRTMGAYKSSMQIDRQTERAMEVEAILGEPLRRARRAGVSTPLLSALYRMARAVDPAARAPRTN